MATVTRYVNLASTAGGDGTTNATSGANRAYASLAEWEAAEQTDLVTDGDSHVVEITGDGTDTDRVEINGWTTGASNTITIRVAEGSRHDGRGRYVSGAGYQLDWSGGFLDAFRLLCGNIALEYMDIYVSATSGTAKRAFSWGGGAVFGPVALTNCIFTSNRTGKEETVDMIGWGADVTMRNCIVVSAQRGVNVRGLVSGGVGLIEHCTFWGRADQLVALFDATATVKDCYAGKATGSAEDFWTGGSAPSGLHNASSDASVDTDYTDSLDSLAGADQFVSVTSGSEDFTLKSGSALEGAGTPLVAVPLDIIGTTRDGTTPDIGAFEFVAAGGGFQSAWARGSNVLIGAGGY